MYKSNSIMSLIRDMKLMWRDKIFLSRDNSVDLFRVLSCRTTFFECLRHNLLSLRQVSNMWRHKPDLLLFRTIAGTGDLLSKHALSILERLKKCGGSPSSRNWLDYQCPKVQVIRFIWAPVSLTKTAVIMIVEGFQALWNRIFSCWWF